MPRTPLFFALLFTASALAQSPSPSPAAPREPRAHLRFDPAEFSPSSEAETEVLYEADQVIAGVPLKDVPGTLDEHRVLVFKKYLKSHVGGKFTPIALENLTLLLLREKKGAELLAFAKELLAPPHHPDRLSAAISLARNHARDAKDPKEALALLEPLSSSPDREVAFRADVGMALVLKAVGRHDEALKRLAAKPESHLTPAHKLERAHGAAMILEDQADTKQGAERTALEDRALEHLEVVMKACEADPAANSIYAGAFASASRIAMNRGDGPGASRPLAAVVKLYPGTMEMMQAESLLPQLELLGKTAPVIDLKGMDGKPVHSKDMKGKITVVDFWATTCPPCIAELPNLSKLVKDMRARPFAIVSISLDAQGRDKVVKSVQARHAMDWPQVYDGLAWKSPSAEKWGVNQLPAIFLVDETWTVKRVSLRGDELRTIVEAEVARLEKKN